MNSLFQLNSEIPIMWCLVKSSELVFTVSFIKEWRFGLVK